MSWKREREPHPDPAIELQLQEILDLRASIDRRTALIGQYRCHIEAGLGHIGSQSRVLGARRRVGGWRGHIEGT